MTTQNLLDELLTVCDREPIQIPGAVQPHGALFALDLNTLRVTHASANLDAFIGTDAAAALGRSAGELLGEERAALLPALALARRADSTAAGLEADLGRGRIALLPFLTGNALAVDVFREPPVDADQPAPPLAQHVIQSLRLSRSSDGLCRIAVNDVRRITNYDRVMIYRFDADGCGDVIAESHAPGVEGFLGLHYPASDIPQQARRLYLLQRIRVIVDVAAVPVTLLAAPGSTATDLDLSASWMRAVSPVHLRYLANMGVGATAVVSLIVAGRLWGMLVCHHNSRREISADQRGQLDLVGQVMSVMLGTLIQSDACTRRVRRKRALAGIAAALADTDASIADAFGACGRNLVNLIPADGVVVTAGDRIIEFGHTPDRQALQNLIAALGEREPADAAATSVLAATLMPVPEGLAGFAGALHVPLPNSDGGSILWLRHELNSIVTWAGNPHKRGPDPDTGRLEPRESFAAWQESVRGRSDPWTDEDLVCARDLRDVVDAAFVRLRPGKLLTRLDCGDSLTGLLSREAIEYHLHALAELPVPPPTAFAILGMDHFSKVNDEYGHAAADALLMQVGQRLQVAVKTGDRVARMGPDEFGVLSTKSLAGELAARLTAVFSPVFAIDKRVVTLSASVGVADNAPVAGGARGLLQSAEIAMRQSKLAGGDRVSIFAEAAAGEDLRRLQIEQSLEAALKSDPDQFQLALQPIVDAGSGVVLGWEVLIRWDHPLLGDIPPGEFIPIAESSGLIEAVGDLVLEAAIVHLVEVPPSVELAGRDVSMSVNVSPLQLTRSGFAVELGAMLDARGIERSRLCLEITEAVLTNAEAVAAIGDIRRLGMLVAIDAFGIGNSSLAALPRLPADIVKLDRSFLPEKDAAITGGRSFLTAIVALAHSAGLQVVVEGVENQVQLDAVVLAGADAVQGYLLGVPMPTEAAMAIACQGTDERAWQPKFARAALFAAGTPLAAESPGILERLRAATRMAHAAIETVPSLSRLRTPELTLADYAQTLRRLHAFFASIEPHLAHALRGRSRAEALVDGAGLNDLAADIHWCGAQPVEPPPLRQAVTSVAAALGALYVIEGSNLGGRVIGRQVAKTLGVGPGTGGSFYCGLNADSARRRWRLLQEVLRLEIDEAGVPWEPVTEAALDTFAALERWMQDGDCLNATRSFETLEHAQ